MQSKLKWLFKDGHPTIGLGILLTIGMLLSFSDPVSGLRRQSEIEDARQWTPAKIQVAKGALLFAQSTIDEAISGNPELNELSRRLATLGAQRTSSSTRMSLRDALPRMSTKVERLDVDLSSYASDRTIEVRAQLQTAEDSISCGRRLSVEVQSGDARVIHLGTWLLPTKS